MKPKYDLAQRISANYNGSPDVAIALSNLQTETGNVHSREELEELRQRKLGVIWNLIDVLRTSDIAPFDPVVSIMSGFDIELPLLLGRDNIVMVDPRLADDQEGRDFRRRVESRYRVVESTTDYMVLKFERNGMHTVAVTLAGQNVYDYIPDTDIGVLLEYKGEPPREFYTKHHLIESIANGGIMFLEGSSEVPPELKPEQFGFRVKRQMARVTGNPGDAIYTAHGVTPKHIGAMGRLAATRMAAHHEMVRGELGLTTELLPIPPNRRK